MGCGCGQSRQWVPPTEEELQAAEARRAERSQRRQLLASGRRGPQAAGYTWNGPQPTPATGENAPS
jgi:hypothetical protein